MCHNILVLLKFFSLIIKIISKRQCLFRFTNSFIHFFAFHLFLCLSFLSCHFSFLLYLLFYWNLKTHCFLNSGKFFCLNSFEDYLLPHLLLCSSYLVCFRLSRWFLSLSYFYMFYMFLILCVFFTYLLCLIILAAAWLIRCSVCPQF